MRPRLRAERKLRISCGPRGVRSQFRSRSLRSVERRGPILWPLPSEVAPPCILCLLQGPLSLHRKTASPLELGPRYCCLAVRTVAAATLERRRVGRPPLHSQPSCPCRPCRAPATWPSCPARGPLLCSPRGALGGLPCASPDFSSQSVGWVGWHVRVQGAGRDSSPQSHPQGSSSSSRHSGSQRQFSVTHSANACGAPKFQVYERCETACSLCEFMVVCVCV